MALTLDRILCPVDQSPLSARAFEYALAIAKWQAADLTVLEVVDWTLPPVAGAVADRVEPPADVVEMAREGLARLIGPARREGVAVTAQVESGRVVEHILETATRTGADLIVMGTHGRGGVQRLVLGSVTEKVIRRASCPVLTVPPGADRVPDKPFRTMFCATDLSEPSRAGIEYAQWLAGKTGARLVLGYVIEFWPFVETSAPVSIEALRESVIAQAHKELTRLAAIGPASDRTEVVVVEGRPKHDVLRLAKDRAADLIVAGVAGRGAVDLAVLGSTTHHIIRSAECPVLTVRHLQSAGGKK